MKKSIIEQIAYKARADFKAQAIDEDGLKKLYQKYNPLDDINLFMDNARRMFPNLNCGLASVYLKEIIPNAKIVKGKYMNNNHTFLMIENLVVDITSDQYGGPEIYVGPLGYPWSLHWL